MDRISRIVCGSLASLVTLLEMLKIRVPNIFIQGDNKKEGTTSKGGGEGETGYGRLFRRRIPVLATTILIAPDVLCENTYEASRPRKYAVGAPNIRSGQRML